MGLLDSISSFLAWSEPVYADAEAADPPKDDGDSKDEEEVKDDGDKEEDKDEDKEEDTEEEAPEPAEEEEEDEPEDPKFKLEEECANSSECKKYKTHYDHCAQRVDEQTEKFGKPKEDCVEEFFELAHCATACAAPALWKQLK